MICPALLMVRSKPDLPDYNSLPTFCQGGVLSGTEPFASARLNSTFPRPAIRAAAFPSRRRALDPVSSLTDFAVGPGSATFAPDKRVFFRFHVMRSCERRLVARPLDRNTSGLTK